MLDEVLFLLTVFLNTVTAQLGTVTVPTTLAPSNRTLITVGVAAAQQIQSGSIGFAQCGGALTLAVERLRRDGYAMEYIVNYTECDRALAVAAGLDFMKNRKVDVIFGPPCQSPLVVMGALSSLYKTPLMAWGYVSASEFTDATRFPYLTTVNPNSLSLGYCVVKVLETFKWNKVALFSANDEMNYCGSVVDDVERAMNDAQTYQIDVSLKLTLPANDDVLYESTLSRAKIILFCAYGGPDRRKYLTKIAKLNMTTNEYVHIYLSLRSSGYGQVVVTDTVLSNGLSPFWLDISKNNADGLDAVAREAAPSTFMIDLQNEVADLNYLQYFKSHLADAVKNPPISCATQECINLNQNMSMGVFARHLHDAMYLYGMALTNLVRNGSSIRDPDAVELAMQTTFPGLSGEVTINQNNTRLPLFVFYGINNKYDQVSFMNVTYFSSVATVSLAYSDESVIWARRGGKRPLTTPICGFLGDKCPKSFMDQYGTLVIILGAVLGVILIALIFFVIYIIRSKQLEQERINSEWQIPITRLQKPPSKKERERQSKRSLQSGPSTTTGDTKFTYDGEFSHYTILYLEREPVITTKHPASTLTKMDYERFVNVFGGGSAIGTGPFEATFTAAASPGRRKSLADYENRAAPPIAPPERSALYRRRSGCGRPGTGPPSCISLCEKLDHDNINKFIGLSIDGAEYVVVLEKMCARGSLQDIISRGNFSMDPFFMFCIIRDIAEGLKFLHHTFLPNHGNLRSGTCLVNDSWQVKITDYGLDNLAEESAPTKKRQLWVAPEVLRNNTPRSQIDKSADVYSFAIVCSEVLTRKPAFDWNDRKESVDELIYLIKKGGRNALRPELDMEGVEMNPAVLHLVRDCWSETPEERPMMDVITNLLSGMMPSKKSNLMDHVFNMLEEYTTTLELEVEERTKELSAEKKKADVLLGRMLPKQVAERLKLGQTVEPEGFDSVSVFFSDVVKFTILATKCSPFQVVNLLNDMYSNFDAIIEEHGVYKVESIGDGYLCVSGLPVRNGYAHIREIVEMSLDFMSYIKSFKIPHLPRETVELRIGINSGPCVAGVVGLSMPRYCLFGDTVNTASRMESNGKASHIHLSGAAHHLLVSQYPHQYETQSRGDVIIKGKGVMETFWVHGRKGDKTVYNRESTPPQKTVLVKTQPKERQITPDSLLSTERSVSPIMQKLDYNNEDALYRKFRKSEPTLA
ncbi:unnamed protein product [Caenorhabditis auriculariae]|uniref:Guanylate cyclase n=1 Tax=Caenorhabditis auriculariae TaxID=2777116 RepID=A0A8S1HSV8_9PELO|nr:unnamed protein product [Caenorhabditis auriculariae]